MYDAAEPTKVLRKNPLSCSNTNKIQYLLLGDTKSALRYEQKVKYFSVTVIFDVFTGNSPVITSSFLDAKTTSI